MATIVADSASYADVSAAVDLASDGDTVQIPAGTATWNSTLDVDIGITIEGAGATSTVITNGMSGVGSSSQPLFSLSITGTSEVKRVTAIGMKGTLITNEFAKKGTGVEANGYGMDKRVDHCQFNDLYCAVWAQSSNGLTDHNLIINCASAFRQSGIGSQQQYAWDNFRNYPDDAPYNTFNYMFHENETIEMTGDSLLTDEVEACSWAIRYCNITYREAHGPYSAAQSFGGIDAHGDIPGSGQYSNISSLLYENDLTVNTGAGMDFFGIRGGQGLIFNNRVVHSGSGDGTAAVKLREERDEGGQPNWGDPQYDDRVHNTYVWNNTYDGDVEEPYVNPPSVGHMHIGTDPVSDPTACCWTSEPASLASLLPTYPHPLQGGEEPAVTSQFGRFIMP